MTLTPEEKKKERKRLLAIRDSIPEATRAGAAQRILQVLREDPAFITCDHLLAYVATHSELNLNAVLEDALSAGKAVYLPRTADREMEFYRIRSM